VKRPGWNTPDHFNGASVTRRETAIFVPMPRKAWRKIDGGCSCVYCSADGKPANAYWDTMAVCAEPPAKASNRCDTTWEVHMPEAHGIAPKRHEASADRYFRRLSAG
jgi:hypothetical protein